MIGSVLAAGYNPGDVSGPAKDAAGGFLNSIGSAFTSMAADLASSVFGFASQKTSIDLNKDYVVHNYNIVFGIAVIVLVGVVLCACIVGALRGDPHVIPRALATAATAILGSFVALTLLEMVLHASDGIAAAFDNGKPLGQGLVTQLRELPARGNVALDIVMSVLVALFSFSLFLVLYVRKIAIIVVAVFIPLYLAGQPSQVTRGWFKRAAEALMALVFAKPVIYMVFALGAGVAGDSSGSGADQTLALLAGMVVMVAAIFTPLALLYVIGFADAQVMAMMAGAGNRLGRTAASFGRGAGSALGSSSRETFRGVGERLQATRRGGAAAGGVAAFGGSAGALGGGFGSIAGGTSGGRPAIRAGGGRPSAAPRSAPAPASGGQDRVAGVSAAPVAAPAAVATRVAPPRTAPATPGRPAPAPSTPRPAPRTVPPPPRGGSGGNAAGTPATRTRVAPPAPRVPSDQPGRSR